MAIANGQFKKGSAQAYAALPIKDPNTFYYVDEQELYLGEILLSNGDNATKMANEIILADSGDLFTSTNVEDALVEVVQMISSASNSNDISVTEETTFDDPNDSGVLKRYIFYKGTGASRQTLTTIDLPKDLMSVSGEVVYQDGEGNTGVFLKLNIGVSAQETTSAVYIDVASMISVFTGGATSEISVTVENNVVTASIVAVAANKVIYQDAVAADPANGIDATPVVTVKGALDDLYDKYNNIHIDGFEWKEIEGADIGQDGSEDEDLDD